MKTTVEISDALLREAKKLAASEGVTLGVLIEQGLRSILARHQSNKPFRLRDASFHGDGLRIEVQGLPWDHLRKLAYHGRGG